MNSNDRGGGEDAMEMKKLRSDQKLNDAVIRGGGEDAMEMKKLRSDQKLNDAVIRGGGEDAMEMKKLRSDQKLNDAVIRGGGGETMSRSDHTITESKKKRGGGGDGKMSRSDHIFKCKRKGSSVLTRRSGWSDLCFDLAVTICTKLNPMEQQLFKQVCSGWRIAGKLCPATNDPGDTWLLSKKINSGKMCIVNRESKRRFKSKNGWKGWILVGSYQSWLLASQPSTNAVKLVHVFSGRTLALPRIPDGLKVAAFTMNKDPCQDDATIYLLAGEQSYVFLLILRKDDPLWRIRSFGYGMDFDQRFIDALYLEDGYLIAADGQYEGEYLLKKPPLFIERDIRGDVDEATMKELEQVGLLLRDSSSCRNGQVKLVGCMLNGVRFPSQGYKFGNGKKAVACWITSSTLDEDREIAFMGEM